MNEITDFGIIQQRIKSQVDESDLRVTQHAAQEMVEENIMFNEVLEAISTAQVIENYPEHRRGACCLISGFTKASRPVHIVCTTEQPRLIIITIYEPKPPKWVTPTKRR